MSRKLNILLRFPLDVWQMIISYLPGPVGYILRYKYWKGRLKHLGEDVRIDVGAYFQNPQYVSIDNNCWIDRGVMILAGQDKSKRPRREVANDCFPLEAGMVHIGKKVHVGPYSIISGIGGVYIADECGIAADTKIFSFSNHYRSDEFPSDRRFCFALFVEHSRQFMIEGPIFLDNNVGVGSNVIILPGTAIGKDSFVLIGSVVKSSFPDNSLIAGNPAKRIGTRFQND